MFIVFHLGFHRVFNMGVEKALGGVCNVSRNPYKVWLRFRILDQGSLPQPHFQSFVPDVSVR